MTIKCIRNPKDTSSLEEKFHRISFRYVTPTCQTLKMLRAYVINEFEKRQEKLVGQESSYREVSKKSRKRQEELMKLGSKYDLLNTPAC